ncbi:MAG: Xaa-Pro peptidase family protein [Oscillospiraceae bacterium]|jgi:Xaa-Pro aminopeptidase|nr:Xaa-Pro peptidase family protein [Oscillospiraceae bacterium]
MDIYSKIRAKFAELNIDAMLIVSTINRRYVTGFPSSDGTLLITSDGAHLIVDSRYIEAARNKAKGADVHLSAKAAAEVEILGNILRSKNIARVGFEDERMPYSQYKAYSKQLKTELIPAEAILTELRTSKSEAEFVKMKAAQALTDEVFSEILTIIKPGMTEKRIAAELTYRMLIRGADNVSFDPIVASGANGSMPHAVPSDKPVERGDFITMDFGCILDGYCSDMTRTVAVGSVTDEMKLVYETVLAAQAAGIAAAKADVSGKSVHEAAHSVIAGAGFGEFFGHGFGHGVGLEIHENPRASISYDKPLPENSIISAEPGIYLPGKFGVRIEDVIIIRKDGAENITHSPKNLITL